MRDTIFFFSFRIIRVLCKLKTVGFFHQIIFKFCCISILNLFYTLFLTIILLIKIPLKIISRLLTPKYFISSQFALTYRNDSCQTKNVPTTLLVHSVYLNFKYKPNCWTTLYYGLKFYLPENNGFPNSRDTGGNFFKRITQHSFHLW